jgi:hypothetical protein
LKQWFDLSGGIAPDQTYWSVEFVKSLNKVRFGTYGRGIWDLNLAYLSSNNNEESRMNQVAVYPNPAQNFLNLKANFDVNRIQIIDSRGKIVETLQLKNQETLKIDIQAYPKGIYYIIFEDENSIGTSKFIKI